MSDCLKVEHFQEYVNHDDLPMICNNFHGIIMSTSESDYTYSFG